MQQIQKIRFVVNFSFLLFIIFSNCKNDEKSIDAELSIATEEYAVLAEKAFSYQSDFDIDGLASMLADDVECHFPENIENTKSLLIGKKAVIDYWKKWQKINNVSKLSFNSFNHFPFKSTKNMKVYGHAGVYVFSLFNSKMILEDGKTTNQRLNVCTHFNHQKRIDRFYTYYDFMPILNHNINYQKNEK